jgi:hypothetical protein
VLQTASVPNYRVLIKALVPSGPTENQPGPSLCVISEDRREQQGEKEGERNRVRKRGIERQTLRKMETACEKQRTVGKIE